MGFLNTILDIVFPLHCISCGMSGVNLCPQCLLTCPLSERETAEWIFPLFDYRHPPIKEAIRLIKYKGKRRLIVPLAEILHGRMIEELSELKIMENFQKPILIPIPLSRKRRRERGFNQAELICQELVKINNLNQNTDWKLEKDVLIKCKDTEHQARIKERQDRLKNLSGSFAVKNSEKIKSYNIILIDDVTTTGATLVEAKKVLKKAGVRKVIAFTLAH